MKVKWQSDTPKMELKVPSEIKIDGGGYPPYELPVATKEVLGGVKVDGDTINITSDGVISTQKVDLSGVATKAELDAVQSSIPDTTGLATKNELSSVEAKIPTTYLKSATVDNNKLTITNADDTSIEFSGGSGGGSSIPVYSFTSGQELTTEEKGQLDIIKNNPKSVIVYIDGLKANNINFVSNTIAFSVDGDATITAGTGTTGSYRYYEPQHGGLYLYSYQLSRIYDTISDSFIIVDDTMITRVRSADFPVVTNIDDLGEYSDLDINFITNWIHNPNQYNVTVSNKPVVYVYNNRNSTSVEAYTLSASYAGLALGGTTLYFSDNKKLAFDSNKTRYYSLGEKVLLDSQNWQNYISLGGQGSWTYTNSTDDGSLYNATELIIMWTYNNEYYCNYYKFDQDSGSTLGGNYQGYTFNAYGQVSGQFNSSWSYNGSAINTSSMDIQSIYYKT